jgi:hypothetical protein
MDSYEYVSRSSKEARLRGRFDLLHAGGQSGVCTTGFAFQDGAGMSPALTVILTVRYLPDSTT